MAKPSKCTPERTRDIEQALLGGASIEGAASHGGISRSTYHDWVARGTAALEVVDHELEAVAEADQPYAAFTETVNAARRQWELSRVTRIQLAGAGVPYEKSITTHREVLSKTGEVLTLSTTVIETGTQFDWRADAWLLERRLPREYGRISRHEVSGPEGKPVSTVALTPDDLDALEAEGLAAVDELAEKRTLREAAIADKAERQSRSGNGQA